MFFKKIKLAFMKVRYDVSLLVQNQHRLRDRIYWLERRVEQLETKRKR